MALRNVLPEDQRNFEAGFARGLATGDFRVECRVKWPDDSVHWVLSTGRLYRTADNEPHYLAGIVQDITETKRREDNAAFLSEISQDCTGLISVEAIMQTVGQKVGAYLKVNRVILSDVKEAEGQLVTNLGWQASNDPNMLGRTYAIGDYLTEELIGAAQAGHNIVICDLDDDPRLPPEYFKFAVRSIVSVPFVEEGKWKFLLTVNGTQPRQWQDDEIELLCEVAGRVFPFIERVRAEEALQISEEKYRTLFNQMEAGYALTELLVDEAGVPVDIVYLEANPAAVQMLGQELVGRHAKDINPDFEPGWFETWDRVARTGLSERHEYKAGQPESWYSTYVFKIGGSGNRLVAAISQDITERKRAEQALRDSEERFRLLVTASSDAVYKMSANWDKMDNLVGKNFIADTTDSNSSWLEKYILPEDHSQVMAVIQQAIQTKSIFEMEHRVVRLGDSTPGWTFSRAIPLLNSHNEITQWLGTASDITQRKQAQEELRQSQVQQTFLLKLSDALRPLTDLVEVQGTASRMLGEHLETDRANYAEIYSDPEGKLYYWVSDAYARDGLSKMVGRFPIEGFSTTILADIQTAWPSVVTNVSTSTTLTEQERQAYLSFNVGSYVVVSYIKSDKNKVMFGVYHTKPRQWTANEISLVEETAKRTWEAVERARAKQIIEQDLTDTRLLRDLAARLVSEENIGVLYNEIMATATALMQADAGTVQILDENTQELMLLAFQGFEQAFVQHFSRLDASSNTSCGMALTTGKRSYVDYDEPFQVDPDGSLRMHLEAGYQSAQSTPLVSRSGKPIGMVSTHWRTLHRPSERELHFLDLLARQAADLIDQWQTQSTLQVSEERFRQVAQITSDAVWDWNLTTNELWWNEGITALFGYEAAQVGLDITWWYEHIHPADRERVRQGLQAAVYNSPQTVWSVEYRFLHAKGHYCEVSDRSFVLRTKTAAARPKPVRMIGAMVDITRQKQEEAQVRFLIKLGEQLRPLTEEKVVFERAARLLGEYLGINRCYFAEVDEPGRLLIHQPDYRKSPRLVSLAGTYPLTLAGWVEELSGAEFSSPLVISDTSTQPIPSRFYRQLYEDSNVRSVLIVPLLKTKEKQTKRKGPLDQTKKLIAVLEQHRQPRVWQAEKITLVQVVLERVWLAVQNARLLSQTKMGAIVEERNRIARYLHDSLQQDFYGIGLQANTVRHLLQADGANGRTTQQVETALDEIFLQAQGGLSGLRSVVFDLRSEAVASEGLVVGLQNYLTSLQAKYRLTIRTHLSAEPALKLEVKEALYWIAREAFYNIIKHAQASQVEIYLSPSLTIPSRVELLIQDNGVGFEPHKVGEPHTGLKLMQERTRQYGGKLSVTSKVGSGTTVRVSFKLAPSYN